jgi:hypothetical protein
MRGGFATPEGLLVSFGIIRTVLIDGAVVARTAIQIDDLRTITVDQARQLREQAGGFAIVQNGGGNTVNGLAQGTTPAQLVQFVQPAGSTQAGQALQPTQSIQLAPGIVIQNTENNRTLQAMTEINAGTNGMRMLQGINLFQTLNDALKGALGR